MKLISSIAPSQNPRDIRRLSQMHRDLREMAWVPPPWLTLIYHHLKNYAPATGLDRPTPRAISERILKIRQTAKASGTSSHLSISNARSNPSTPRKNAANGRIKKATPKKTNGSKAKAGKRKRAGMLSDMYVFPTRLLTRPANTNVFQSGASDDTADKGFKADNNGPDTSHDEGTSRKRSKSNTVAKSKSKDMDLVKVKSEETMNGTFEDSYKNSSVEDDPMGIADCAWKR